MKKALLTVLLIGAVLIAGNYIKEEVQTEQPTQLADPIPGG